jgi:Protein of unknown function (DUF3631)
LNDTFWGQTTAPALPLEVRDSEESTEIIAAGDLPPLDTEGHELEELLDQLASFLRRYVVLTPAQADAIALWIIHSHAFEAAETTPYLAITSAEKRSGKTRLLEVLEVLVANPMRTADMSEAALFRSLANEQATLLLDEVDAIFGPKTRERESLRAMLNAGHRRGATVRRVVGEGPTMRVEAFPVFCPKALAAIGQLPDTVADRSIPIRLKRAAPSEPLERWRKREADPEAEKLRLRLAEVTAVSLEALTEARPSIPAELDDRAADGWEPLLAIADLAGGNWPERARRAALELSAGQLREEESVGIRLLADIRRVFTEHGADRLPSTELAAALGEIEEAPWGDWRGKTLDTRALAGLLKRYDIRPKVIRIGDKTPSGYLKEWFEDPWRRYLPAQEPSELNKVNTRLDAPHTYGF